jgi:hypothetical protein
LPREGIEKIKHHNSQTTESAWLPINQSMNK